MPNSRICNRPFRWTGCRDTQLIRYWRCDGVYNLVSAFAPGLVTIDFRTTTALATTAPSATALASATHASATTTDIATAKEEKKNHFKSHTVGRGLAHPVVYVLNDRPGISVKVAAI